MYNLQILGNYVNIKRTSDQVTIFNHRISDVYVYVNENGLLKINTHSRQYIVGDAGYMKLSYSVDEILYNNSSVTLEFIENEINTKQSLLEMEEDPLFTGSASATITAGDISRWNDAFSWGDHSTEGYITSEQDSIFISSEAANFLDGDKEKLDNQSGINTGDETILTLQSKRPLKTVEGESLEGTGNIEITKTKEDVGLGNVPNLDTSLRSNHTGTQTSNSISDFQISVSNNSDVQNNTAKLSATGNEIEPSDIDTLSKLNSIITDADLVSSIDPRLNDSRNPNPHTHTKSEIIDFNEADYATASQGSNADTSFSWGDHSTEGYLTSETDPIFVESEAFKFVSGDKNSYDEIVNKRGWWNIQDTTHISSSPQTILANTRTKLEINLDDIVESFSPTGKTASSIWDGINYKLTPFESGDSFIVRLSLTANPTLNNRNFTVDLDIGGSIGIIFERTVRLGRGANFDTKISMTNSIFCLGTFVANGGEIYVTCDGDVDLFNKSLFIQQIT